VLRFGNSRARRSNVLGQTSDDLNAFLVIVGLVSLAWAVFVVFWMVDVRKHLENIHFLLIDLVDHFEQDEEQPDEEDWTRDEDET
jgi:hypothetical protein